MSSWNATQGPRQGDASRSLVQLIKLQATVLGAFIAVFWGLELLDIVLLGGALDGLGIRPRQVSGIKGVFFAPFLHFGLGHLISNTVPFLVFGWLIMLRQTWHLFYVFLVSMIVAGVGVWLIGSSGVHLGASGVIFGMFGFLVSYGFFERKVGSILLSLGVGFFYGGMIWGVLPTMQRISWESHLFGFVGGLFAAYLLAKSKRGRLQRA